jgi:ATP-dependent 26S proteasome regulatory subunit
MPNIQEREKLWHLAFPKQIKFDPSVDISSVANDFELTGANIMNIVQHCCIQALSREDTLITQNDIILSVKRELAKFGSIL